MSLSVREFHAPRALESRWPTRTESLNVGEARGVGGNEWTEEFTVTTANPIPLSTA
jgi:hypothetical protein